MLKVTSKKDCSRCEEIKNYLNGRGIEYLEEIAEDKGYSYWRNFIQGVTGNLGFPLLIHDDGQTTGFINGSSEEIIERINEWYPSNSPSKENVYFWGK